MKNDDDILKSYTYIENLPTISGVKDLNGAFQALSAQALSLLGWQNSSESLGKTDYDIPSKASEAADLFTGLDKKVKNLDLPMAALEVTNFSPGVRILLDNKVPIKNLQNKTIGVFFYSIDMTSLFAKSFGALNSFDSKFQSPLQINKPKQYIITPEASPLPISPRQQECLSLLLRGKTVKEIAYVLGISSRTVETYIVQMKYKLGCNTKSQLIELAIESGFLFHVPEMFFGLNLF